METFLFIVFAFIVYLVFASPEERAPSRDTGCCDSDRSPYPPDYERGWRG